MNPLPPERKPFQDNGWQAAQRSPVSAAAPVGSGVRPMRGGLVEAGVGAAGAVSPLAALHHAGDLQAGHHRKTAVPDLRRAQSSPRMLHTSPPFFPLHVCSASSNVGKRGMGVSSRSAASPHHEGWNNGLLELCFEGVHQLFGFGVVEGENTCGGGRGLRGISDAVFISSFHSSNRLSHAAVVCVSLLYLRLESNYESRSLLLLLTLCFGSLQAVCFL